MIQIVMLDHSQSFKFEIVLVLILTLYCQETLGTRAVDGERWRRQKRSLVIQSLPRGPVPSSGSSPCTYIPGGKKRGRCALAVDGGRLPGHATAAPPAWRQVKANLRMEEKLSR
ncbi:hypothetical protein F511_06728 [Dorcoceras hygrometricum]|uniref:Secreted protein n=1 Tax=Dorcoceras hygrometricum TaxID=472368 RepID=A0A2Z7DDY2_9LAMI|nr:hypothetical protein F511_06728 [Dorcoceras hygrometricum]